MDFIRRHYLPATVFITGACVLIVEVVATRILSPYFGNTIFTVSSVLSVVLAALSVGYWVGGRLADKRPDAKIFFGIILLGGIGVLLVHWLQVLLLPTLGNSLSLTTGPLLASTLLFFFPSFVLGMLSPFAIKLQDMLQKKQGIGSIAGEMFFFSTVGSIVGSLLAGYGLIPHFGVGAIILGTGVVLVALGLVPLVLLGMDKKQAIKIGAVVLGLVVLQGFTGPSVDALYSRNGIYEKIIIREGMYEGHPTRFLFQDRSASGAMYIGSNEHVYDYSKYYALHEVFTPKLDRALVIGGGAYTVPKSLLQENSNVHVDVAEIEPSLVELSEKYFDVPKNEPRLHHHIADGRRLLHDAPHRYDMIFSDVYYSLYSIPMHFTTKEFFQSAYNKLANDGIFVANIIGSIEDRPPSLVLSEIKTLQTVFPQVYAFATQSPNDTGVQNIILVGHKSKQQVTFDAQLLAASSHEVIRTLPQHKVDVANLNLADYPVLTDDFAPVENWTAELLRRR